VRDRVRVERTALGIAGEQNTIFTKWQKRGQHPPGSRQSP